MLPAYADNMALPAFVLSTGRAAVDPCILPAGSTAGNSSGFTAAETDRRTDSLPLHKPCSAYYASSVSNYTLLYSDMR